MHRSFRLAFFLLLTVTNVLSQQLRFKTLSLINGLSQSTVNSIVQDNQGFIWIATQDGLNRFDGYSFKVFKHDPKNRNSIPDNYVQSLFKDSKGLLWIGTYGGGLSSYDPTSEKFINYRHSDQDIGTLSSDQVMSICEDSSGDLWIGTSKGLNRLKKGTTTFQRFIHDHRPTSISSDKIRVVFKDIKDEIWIGTADSGLNRFIKEKEVRQ